MSPDQPGRMQPQRLNIEIPQDLEAIYANFALITHSPSEIVVDFARLLPNQPKSRVHARIVMTPMNAKLVYRALGENLQKFEKQFGEIKTPDQGFDSERPMGFRDANE